MSGRCDERRPSGTFVPLRLRVAIFAVDPATARHLAERVAAAGHTPVVDGKPADVGLTKGAVAAAGLPFVVLGDEDEDVPGLLPEDAGPAQLDAALRAVAAGLVVRPASSAQSGFAALADAPEPRLTPREIEVLTALADGLGNKAVARRLGISPHTVKFHIESVFRKLGAGTRAEAVAKGLRQQIVEF